jgi:hypothetical protein
MSFPTNIIHNCFIIQERLDNPISIYLLLFQLLSQTGAPDNTFTPTYSSNRWTSFVEP